ncbi:uncharacterized protein LOC129947791 [Eupeodes corollae]|uniref:uncharacterized protein LOC129947791 n=1 Tax=Eupeodes corollae TaxID=290404 RepID=UPI002490C5A2|nr:uncharacterized protein LOC129947791 [Eupeodes corollae]
MLKFAFTFLLVIIPIILVKTDSTNTTDTWNGNWFPRNPLKQTTEKIDLKGLFGATKSETNINDSWTGNWFPRNPLKQTTEKIDLKELFGAKKSETNINDSWEGNWFPHNPNAKVNNIQSGNYVQSDCDDGEKNIDIDFDPENKQHNYKYLCLNLRKKYEPNYATSPIQRETIIPPAYKAPVYCQNETIEYEERLPTYGAHRQLYPQYGEYKFLPIQRWMHNLRYGAVVMLYHPCANQMQIEKLRGTLNACLYRHIITPSTMLLPERPLALLAWGKSLEMSVVDVRTVVDFITSSAKKGQDKGEPDFGKYDRGLIAEAKLVTDETDSEICANINL